MEKYFYECKNRLCLHLHEKDGKANIEGCEKCNHNEVEFVASYKIYYTGR